MRYIIILLTVLAACEQPSKTVQQQVFDDYLLLHFNSWGDAIGRNYIPEFYYELGDTVRLRSELAIMLTPYDAAQIEIDVIPENYITLDSGTLIKIASEAIKFSFEASFNEADSIYNGIVMIDKFLEAQWGKEHLNYTRKNLFEQLMISKKERLSELSEKYELSQDSILNLISYEYFERTGRRGINY